jgi:Mannosyltransferase (PIG-V)
MIPGGVGAVQRLRERGGPALPPRLSTSGNPALEIFAWSRLALWGALLFAFLWFEPKPAPLALLWDSESVHDVGWLVDVWARWDSAWFVRIAEDGYGADPERTPAFFPLYPALVAGLGRVLGGHFVLAGLAISMAACAGAFALLFRLAEERLGADGARRTVLYLAVFPVSLFLGAVYSESLFLLLALAAFLLAQRGRWLEAGGAAGLALLTRAFGLALLPALVLLAWRSSDRRRALAGLAVAPAMFAAYPLLLWRQIDDPWAFLDAQDQWNRRLTWLGPVQGVWDGARAAWAGVRQIVAGADGRIYWPIRDAEPLHAAMVNLSAFLYLLLFTALAVVAWRRFGAPYGLFAALSLLLPLSVPSERWPLLSLPRFGLVVFPLFLALAALAAGRPRFHTGIVAVSALLLGVAVVQWATWQWVA